LIADDFQKLYSPIIIKLHSCSLTGTLHILENVETFL